MGPILFILYVNGVFELHLTINIKLFADDAKLYRPIATPMDLTTMQDDINKIWEHFSSSQLNINASKSEVLHLGHNNSNQIYSLDDVAIPEKMHAGT